MNTFVKKQLCLSLLLAPLMFLSGCLPGSDKDQAALTGQVGAKKLDDGSEVLLKIDGRPVITMNSLNAEFDRLLEESPQMRQIFQFYPEAKSNFFQGMVNQEIVDHYVSANGVDRSPQYIQEFENTMRQVTKMLNTKYFSEKHPVQVSDAEVVAFYNENKNRIPDLMISEGGVKAEGVSFGNEDEANAFLAKAKESKVALEKVASDAGFKDNYRDFNMVNDKSLPTEPALRTRVMSLTSFPSHEVVKVGDAWWVVKAHSKEEPKYHPLNDELRPQLQEHIKKDKQNKAVLDAIESYKKDFDIEVNDEPLKAKEDEKASNPLAQIMAQQEAAMAQQQETPAKELAEAPQQVMQTV